MCVSVRACVRACVRSCACACACVYVLMHACLLGPMGAAAGSVVGKLPVFNKPVQVYIDVCGCGCGCGWVWVGVVRRKAAGLERAGPDLC